MILSRRRVDVLCLSLLLVLAAFLRLYRLDDTLHWRGDEGRDASIMYSMIVDHRLVLVGPPTSVTTDAGSLYLGPATYYLMGVGLWLMDGDPLGPAIVVVVFSVLTVWLLWLVGRAWFSPAAGWIAAVVFAFSPNAILFGRHAWNPNVMPFFALLTIWAIWQAWTRRQSWWWLVAVGAFAVAIQSHAFGWTLLPVVLASWIVVARKTQEGSERRGLWRASVWSALVGLVFVCPLILYDATHQWYSWHVLAAYVTSQTGQGFGTLHGMGVRLFHQAQFTFEDIFHGSTVWRTWIALALLALSAAVLSHRPSAKDRVALWLLGGWILCGLVGLVLFRGPIFVQYREVLWPAVILLLAWLGSCVLMPWRNSKYLPAVSIVAVSLFALIRLVASPTTEAPSFDYRSTLMATALVRTTSGNQPFALTMVSARSNSDAAYRYMMEWKFRPPSILIQSKQLYAVCEGSRCNLADLQSQLPAEWKNGVISQVWQLSPTVILARLQRQP